MTLHSRLSKGTQKTSKWVSMQNWVIWLIFCPWDDTLGLKWHTLVHSVSSHGQKICQISQFYVLTHFHVFCGLKSVFIPKIKSTDNSEAESTTERKHGYNIMERALRNYIVRSYTYHNQCSALWLQPLVYLDMTLDNIPNLLTTK